MNKVMHIKTKDNNIKGKRLKLSKDLEYFVSSTFRESITNHGKSLPCGNSL